MNKLHAANKHSHKKNVTKFRITLGTKMWLEPHEGLTMREVIEKDIQFAAWITKRYQSKTTQKVLDTVSLNMWRMKL
jgi:hypothetical protein